MSGDSDGHPADRAAAAGEAGDASPVGDDALRDILDPYNEMLRSASELAADPYRQGLARVADGVRRIIEGLASHQPPAGELDRAAGMIDAVAEMLAGQPWGREYGAFAESANAPTPYTFFDHSPMIGIANPLAPPAELRIEDDRVVGTVTFGSAYEGPPGHVHGGYLAAAFDELLGMAQTLSGRSGMTGTLKVVYRLPTPLHRRLDLEAELISVEGRKVTVGGRCSVDGRLTAESEGIFISLDAERFSRLLADRDQPAGH